MELKLPYIIKSMTMKTLLLTISALNEFAWLIYGT